MSSLVEKPTTKKPIPKDPSQKTNSATKSQSRALGNSEVSSPHRQPPKLTTLQAEPPLPSRPPAPPPSLASDSPPVAHTPEEQAVIAKKARIPAMVATAMGLNQMAGSPGYPPPPLASDSPPVAHTPEEQAVIVQKALIPAMMATAMGLDQMAGSPGYRLFLDQILKDMEDPNDMTELMLCEQLGLAHVRLGKLHADAGQARSPEASKLANAASIRMMSEFRQLALALETYRISRRQRRQQQQDPHKGSPERGQSDGATPTK